MPAYCHQLATALEIQGVPGVDGARRGQFDAIVVVRPIVCCMERARHRRPLQYTRGLFLRSVDHHGDHGGGQTPGPFQGQGINGRGGRAPDVAELTAGFNLPCLTAAVFPPGQ